MMPRAATTAAADAITFIINGSDRREWQHSCVPTHLDTSLELPGMDFDSRNFHMMMMMMD